MIQFVNTGLDDMILKSLNAVTPDEDLCKAMNKQGMVQKEVQVRGKNGTFTRKQWVRASDVQNSNQSQSHSKTESDKSVTLKRAKLSLSNGSGIPESLSNVAFGFTENMRQSKFPHIKNTGYQDSAQAFREIVESANPTGKGICDALNSSGIGYRNWKVTSESSDKIVIQASDTLGNKYNLAVFPIKQKSQEPSNKPTSDKGQDSSTSQVKLDKTKSGKVSETQAKDLSQMSESEIKSRMKQIATRIGEVSNEMNNNSKSSAQLNSVATPEQKKEYDALIEENAELMIELGKRQRKDTSVKSGVKQKDSSKTSLSSSKFDGDVVIDALNSVNQGVTKRFSTPGSSNIKNIAMNISSKKEFMNIVNKNNGVINNDSKDNGTNGNFTVNEHKVDFFLKGKKLVLSFDLNSTGSDKNYVKQKDSSTTSSISFDLPSGKNTKQAVTDLLASHSRSDIMSAAKSAGITWKENAHEGINWMRASMAIQKYMSK